MADRIAIFCDGQIRMNGTPDEVFRRPNSAFVAEFVGSRNLIAGELDEHGVFRAGELALTVASEARGKATLIIRPEELQLGALGEFELAGEVLRVVPTEHHLRVNVTAAGLNWDVLCPAPRARELGVGEGQAVSLGVPVERCHVIGVAG